jgi:Domain of unknown function (DUF4331)
MSSHREAPEISKDPVADNTDVYAFISPDRPGYVTLIANFIPLQIPDSGPNFWEFGDDVTYKINISNAGKSQADIVYAFNFKTTIRNKNTFLYNTGPIKKITDTTWNRPQYYTITRKAGSAAAVTLGSNLTVPPVNVGWRSTFEYDDIAAQAIHSLPGDRKVFAGQRGDAFHADLGSIFDLGALRPFESHHLIPSAAAMGINGLQGLNVHSIALQVPVADLTFGGKKPSGVMDAHATIGVWASAERPKSKVANGDGTFTSVGPNVQVSRLGNPLVNEVLNPMAEKDEWNSDAPSGDSKYAANVTKPELAGLLPVLYPGVFPNLAKYTKPRADLAAILLTGIPAGVVPGFQNYTGPVQADMVRLNVAVPASKKENPIGLVAGDAAGFPNGRRLRDDVVAIELKAIAGATIPLVDPSFKPDAVAAQLNDGTKQTNLAIKKTFPYMPAPASGFRSTPGTPKA